MEKNEGKRKWERDYEKYSSSIELDERIEYLQNLVDDKHATKEEYEEHKKLTAIKNNLPKVKHILEKKEKLNLEIKGLEDEIARRQLVDKYNQAAKVLEDEMKKLQEEKVRLEEEIKQNPEKKAELQTKLAENDKKRQENNLKFVKCQEGIANENKNAEQSQFKDTSIEDLKNNKKELEQKRRVCNFACNKLMQGYSWKSVEADLYKFQGERLTAKGKEAAKIQQNREAAKGNNQKEVETEQKEVETEQKEVETEQKEVEAEQEAEVALSEVSRWQKIKLWLAGIGSKASEGIKKFIGKFRKTEEIEEIEEEDVIKEEPKKTGSNIWSEWYKKYQKEPKEVQEAVEQEVEVQEAVEQEVEVQDAVEQEVEVQDAKQPTTNKHIEFIKQLKEIAEKGMDGVEKENKETRRQAAIEKLKANRAGKDTGATITNLDKEIHGQDGDER